MSTIDRATTKVATWYVRQPCTCFAGCLFMMFALSGLSAGLGYMNLMTREDTWMILDGEMTQHFRAYRAARESVLEEFQADDADDDRDYNQERLFFFYKTDVEGTGTLFTPERLVSICEVEKTMLANNSQVKAVPTGDSVLGLFYGTAANPAMQSVPAARTIAGYDWSCQKLSQSDVDSVVDTMHTDLASKGPQSLYARFVDPNFRETKQTAYSRTFAELQVLRNDDEVKVMEPAFEKLGLAYGFLRSAFQGDEDRFVQSGDIRVRVTYTGINEIQKMALPDFGLSFFSVILVFGVSWVHMKSSFMASAALLMMILTLPIASLFYQGVFRIEYFEFLHILVVYLVLGIGADDVYVFKDTFCHVKKAEFPFAQPGRLTEEQEIRVLSLTFQRAGTAIFNTSFTTALAFASCSVSKAMPMRTCGWYAATCIVTLYVLTLVYYPPVVILWHRRLQSKRCCCPGLTERPTAVVPEGMFKEKKVDQEEESAGPVERFFEKLYIPVMSKQVGGLRIYALFLALLLLAVAIQGIAFAMQLTPPRSEEVWFPGNHMLLSLQDFMADNFYTPSSDNYAVVTIFLGIAGLDKTGIQVYDPGAFTGTAIYDDAFDLSTAEAQSALLSICDKVHNITCDLQGCDNSGYDQKTFLMQTSERTDACFLKDFQTWLNGPLPTGANFTAQLKNFRDNAVVGDYYGDIMKKEVNFKEDIGFIAGELKYVAIKFRSVMKKRLPFSIGTEVRDMLREWMDQQRGPLPSSLQSIKFHGNGEFQRYDMGEELINGLFSGIAIAMPVSFLVLLSSTRNMVVAIYAVLTVGSIVLCVLGFCKSAMDWDLGIGEAIAGVIVIGYSVDYVVHLAHMYCEAKHFGHETRDDRAKFAIRNMGSTIFAGALTTMLAGATMFMCFFYFFIKMALLICVTIMYSFLYSLVFFMAVLWLAGPEYNFGYLCLPKWCMGGSHKEEEVTIVNKDVQESNTADAEKPAKEYDPAEITEQELDEGPRTIQVP